jgi:superoxide reductase
MAEVKSDQFKELYQTADWKQEKHVPVIDVPAEVPKGEFFEVKVTIGKEVAHPNKTEHHIRWIDVYFHPEDGKFPFHIGRADFTAHGESTEGPDSSTVYTHHAATLSFKTEKPGVIYATSYCNIHGVWESSREIRVR